MAFKHGECPDQCNGKGLNRQMTVGSLLLSKFPSSAQAKISELGTPMRCTYCGCVYVGSFKIGTWDSGILGQGWHSSRFPNT